MECLRIGSDGSSCMETMEGKESRRRPVKSGRWSKGLGRGTEGAEGEGERDEA